MEPIERLKNIVLVDDDETVLTSINSLFRVETDYSVNTFLSPKEALNYIKNMSADLVISDYLMDEMDGITFLSKVRDLFPEVPRIIITAYADKENVIKAVNEVGLFHYIEKPWNNEDFLIIVRNGLEKKRLISDLKNALNEVKKLKDRLQEENRYLQEEIKQEHNFEEIISQNTTFRNVLRNVEKVAPTDSTVLILGETGTGKELIARAVHNLSDRKNRPLVKVNCASLSANLVESELFGHEKGAFTGAVSQKTGRFELADGGTVFLDEIGDLPPELQVKLLRFLQEGEFERIGGNRTIKVNVRIIAATNRNLETAMEKGEFREDLYYRLNIFPVYSPPLRERKDDISLLVGHFISKHSRRIGRKIENIPVSVIERLEKYHWPGNIRELENIIERSLILSSGKNLQLGDWFMKLGRTSADKSFDTLDGFDKKYIMEVLDSTGWRVSGENGAAEILGLKPTTLEAKMSKLGIRRGNK